ncbi:hypothetical protein EVG20_g11699 [Dentipellis fragilis]|uniref:Uncharacterized protein n=1 Tax=Dentipellis fragilis TaxID=205917 RepID=A0A4Y9XKF2_9AGAM|nr:hypothetical protein EVG20_g11699 [Dentipellis fragilis]
MKDSAWATKAYSMNPHLSGEHFRCDYSLMEKNKLERKLTYYAVLGWLILQKGNPGVAEDGTVMVIKKDARPADTESNESDDIRMIDVIDVDTLDDDSDLRRGEGPSNKDDNIPGPRIKRPVMHPPPKPTQKTDLKTPH